MIPVVLALALAGTGCGNRVSDLGPTGNPRTAAITVETFAGVVPVGGSRFYSFTVPQDGLVSFTLLVLTENGAASAALVNVGIGFPRATDCQVLDSRTTGVGAIPAFTDAFPAGVYCVRVADVGNLTADATFAVNITHPR